MTGAEVIDTVLNVLTFAFIGFLIWGLRAWKRQQVEPRDTGAAGGVR